MTMTRPSNVFVCCGALLTIAGCSDTPVEHAEKSAETQTQTQTTSTPPLPQEPLETAPTASDASEVSGEFPATDQPDVTPDVVATAPAQDDPPPAVGRTVITSADGAYTVAYTIDPEPIPLNELFGLHVEITEASGELIDASKVSLIVDARMPQHRHGMNTIPNVRLNDDGTFTVSEMLFHMPGFWELYFDITDGAVTERAQAEIDIE